MGKDIYRKRINSPLNKKVLSFISSLEEDLWITEEDILGTEAHNIMLFEQDIIKRNDIKLILISLEKIRKRFKENQLELDYNFEDIHPLIEQWVINDIGMEIGGKIHTGRSRNDQVSLDIRLKIRSELNYLSLNLIELINILINLSKESTDIYVPLYTHLQKGQLGTFSHYINNYISQILRSLKRIDEIYKRINCSPLGACAIGGTSINIDRHRTADLLGFDGVIINTIDAISSRDYVFETLSCLALVSIQFSRLAEDLLIWSSKEFDFIEIDDQFCSVSSVMPQKRNPDTIELIRSKSSKIISSLFTASLIIKAIPTGYFRDFQELKMLLKTSFEIIQSITEMFKGIFSTIKLNKQNMIESINEGFILALDLAEFLVQEHQLPFRQTHEIVAKIVNDSKKNRDLFNKDNLEKIIQEVIMKKITLSTQKLDSFKNLEHCLNNRKSQGSPSKFEVNKLLSILEERKETLSESCKRKINAIKIAYDTLSKRIKELSQ